MWERSPCTISASWTRMLYEQITCSVWIWYNTHVFHAALCSASRPCSGVFRARTGGCMASLEPASEMQELVERFAYSEDLRTTLCVYPSGTTRNSNYCTVLY